MADRRGLVVSATVVLSFGAGRPSRADRNRTFGIARGEAVEAVAAVEIVELAGDCDAGAAARCIPLADRVALLTGFLR